MAQTADTTSTGHWREAFALAESLEQQPRDAQRAHIEMLAASDPQLAHRLGLLLGSETTKAEIEASVTKVLGATRVAAENPLKTDDNVGAYTLIRRLGRGGMADVWLAQRTDGALKRPVALKLPMAVMPAAMLAERFARERDMLAQLDHPNIARIYDTGTTAQGQPFLALEFIDGEPLDHYCRAAKSSINARVQLALQVAHAVHHAHSRLVLHRDLKPSNILVTKDGTVKVLDFGIAKLLSEERTAEETQFTRMTGAALTPKYAAPEQLLSETVTTSTDTYALAVVLYELLSGAIPFIDNAKDLSARMATLNSPCRLLSETAISAPQVLALGLNSERAVKRALAGDLTAILDKALRRAPNDRYPSALAFAEDLERYLTSRPVLARQGAVTYRVRKFLNRHRVPVAVAAMGTLAATGLGLQAITQSQKAAQSQSRADSIDGLMESLFQGMSPDIAAKRTFTAKELLDRASGYLTKGGSSGDAQLDLTNARMATLYRDIGAFQDAIRLNSARLAAAKQKNDVLGQISALRELANCAQRDREFERAQKYADEARALIGLNNEPAWKIELARLANIEGSTASRMFQNELSRTRFAEAERLWKALQPDNVEQIAWALEGQSHADRIEGNIASAKAKLNEVLALDDRYQNRGVMDRIHTRHQLATLNYLDGRFAEANPVLRHACDALLARLDVNHTDTHIPCFNAAYSSIRLGAWDDAKTRIETLDTATAYRDGADRPVEQLRALYALYLGQSDEAEKRFRTVIESFRLLENTPGSARSILRFQRYEAEASLRSGKTAFACESLRRIERAFFAAGGEANTDTGSVRILLAICALRQNDSTTAKTLIASATKTFSSLRGEHHPFTLAAYAYRELCEPSAARTAIITRLREEMLWQSGAQQLIEIMELGEKPSDLTKTPVVL